MTKTLKCVVFYANYSSCKNIFLYNTEVLNIERILFIKMRIKETAIESNNVKGFGSDFSMPVLIRCFLLSYTHLT